MRRTDKIGSEAALHELSEYMAHAEEFFDIYKLMHNAGNFTKAIYLASDETAVLREAKEK